MHATSSPIFAKPSTPPNTEKGKAPVLVPEPFSWSGPRIAIAGVSGSGRAAGCGNRDRNRRGVVTVRIDRNGRRTSCGVDARNGKRGRVIAAALAIRLLRGGAYRCARRVGNRRRDLVSRTRVHHKRRGNTGCCERQYVRRRAHVRNVADAALIA